MNIVISGTVGVGKSTISKKIREKLSLYLKKDCILIKEINENNPILDLYYKERESWSFIIQIEFILNRFKKAINNNNNKFINIFDRHFIDDFIFASLPIIKDNIFAQNWNVYKLLNDELLNLLKEKSNIDYFFLLKADFDIIIKRIKERGRESEKNVDINYWKNLYFHYYENKDTQDYISNLVKNFIIIDANSINMDKITQNIIKYIK